MYFSQATVALALALGVTAHPLANGGGSAPPPQGGNCNAGSAKCLQNGFFTEYQEQDCEGGDTYCCENGDGANIGSCTSILSGLTITLKKRDLEARNGGGSAPPQGGNCNGGSVGCVQNGIFTEDQYQDCYGGNAMCCSSGDGLNALSCSPIGSIDLDLGGLTRRNGGGGGGEPAPQGGNCNGGSVACKQNGVFTESQDQYCYGGDAYCCSSGNGINVLSCSQIGGPITIDLGLGDVLSRVTEKARK